MNRMELERHVAETIDAGGQYIWLLMNGDPMTSRQRLLGHHWGPKGWVCGHSAPNNIVRFNAELIQEYLDELPTDKLPWDDDVRCEVASEELLDDYCDWRGRLFGEDPP